MTTVELLSGGLDFFLAEESIERSERQTAQTSSFGSQSE
eukprot:CAMPEP_0183341150 /NCGR_PEP_ID=MMETSP0164_2-20130417/7443_1 /TAXON_ID=221442 /ORGANISM="Coccolithus pelagicus ssp braarudi, Strain PLY182g" /LENGTH=38 /DNA_ID= /DNA_START= /DNA_END= /DNA_ORIENTATION=